MREAGAPLGVHKQKEQFLAARVSIAGSIVMFLVSTVIAFMTDSITLILDASASLVILVVGFLIHFSVKKIHQPPDELYNFGYHKYEPLTAAIQNMLIIVVCAVSIKFAVQDIIHAENMHSYGLPAVGIFCEAIIALCIALYLKGIGRRTNSQMIKASSFHWFLDTALSFGLCAGFCVALILHGSRWAGLTPYIDPSMAILLALFFISAPVRGGLHNVFELLDAAPVSDIREKIKEVVNQYRPGAFGTHRLRIRKAGQKIFVDVCFIAEGSLTLSNAGEMAERFEKELRTHLPDCDVVVYFKSAKA